LGPEDAFGFLSLPLLIDLLLMLSICGARVRRFQMNLPVNLGVSSLFVTLKQSPLGSVGSAYVLSLPLFPFVLRQGGDVIERNGTLKGLPILFFRRDGGHGASFHF